MLRIKLVKGIHGQKPRNAATLKALGFRKTGHTVYHENNAVIQGMIQHVRYALEVSEVTAEEAKAAQAATPTQGIKVTPGTGAPKVKAAKAEAKPKAAAKPAAAKAAAGDKPKKTAKKAEESK